MTLLREHENRTATATGSPSILVVDDHEQVRRSLSETLDLLGYRVASAAGPHEALSTIADLPEGKAFDLILTDLNMPGMSGVEFIRELRHRQIESQIVMITAYASIDSAVEAMRYGAFDYLEKPLKADQLEHIVQRALQAATRDDKPTQFTPGESSPSGVMMIGGSPAMQTLRRRIQLAAASDETVLITGENGTGKELIARSLHALSQRGQQQMVSLNCPVLSAQLMESELFGHERGAFTSADAPRVGRFELADGGTLLLDEITEIELPLQAKLLRVLQEKTYERVGDSQTNQVDVRVLATTNRDLREEVSAGRFREDLYFRLAVVELQAPALRERKEDIPALINHFALQVQQRTGGEPPRFDAAADALLRTYHWPGNVRELENIVTRAAVFSEGREVKAGDLRDWLICGDASAEVESTGSTFDVCAGGGMSLQEMERKMIEATLERFDGHRQKTADALGIGVRTLSGKLRSYGLAPRAKTFSKAA